jgi:hypothetical protein
MIFSVARPFFLVATAPKKNVLIYLCWLCLNRLVVIIMFNVDIARRRVVIAHTVKTVDGRVHLTTTFDLCDVSEEKMLLWAATNRLTRWLASVELGQLSSAEVKGRFDNLVIECREYLQPDAQSITREEKIMVDNLRKVLGKGVPMEQVLQALIRSTLQLGH